MHKSEQEQLCDFHTFDFYFTFSGRIDSDLDFSATIDFDLDFSARIDSFDGSSLKVWAFSGAGKHTKSLLKYVTVIGHQSWETITAPIYHNLSLQEITGRGNPCENWWQLFNRQRIETDTVSNLSKDYFIVEIGDGSVLTYDYFSDFSFIFFPWGYWQRR